MVKQACRKKHIPTTTMKSRTLCSFSFHGLPRIPEPVGVVEFRIKERYQLVMSRSPGPEMVVVDDEFPQVGGVFIGTVDKFSHPQRRRLHVLNILASLQLGVEDAMFERMTRNMLSFLTEVVARSGGYGFCLVVKVDMLKVETEDGLYECSSEEEGGEGERCDGLTVDSSDEDGYHGEAWLEFEDDGDDIDGEAPGLLQHSDSSFV